MDKVEDADTKRLQELVRLKNINHSKKREAFLQARFLKKFDKNYDDKIGWNTSQH